jgi:hypothetical protein
LPENITSTSLALPEKDTLVQNMWKLLFYNGKAPAPQTYFMTILGSGALFFILLTSAIDAIESNMAVRNIRLYD